MRPARKAASRPSHALVPSSKCPPAYSYHPPRRRRVSYISGDVLKSGETSVPRRSRSRMCKAPTWPFSKARTTALIDSSPDSCSVGSVMRSIARGAGTYTGQSGRPGPSRHREARFGVLGICHMACLGCGGARRRVLSCTTDRRVASGRPTQRVLPGTLPAVPES